MELPYDPAIPLLGIYPKKPKTLIQKDICTPMFTAVLITILKISKEPKCPSVNEWIKKWWYVYTTKYYLALKNNKILPFSTTWVDLEDIMLSEISQRQMPPDFTYMWNLNNKI